MSSSQRMKIANQKASKYVTMRGNVPKSSVSCLFWVFSVALTEFRTSTNRVRWHLASICAKFREVSLIGATEVSSWLSSTFSNLWYRSVSHRGNVVCYDPDAMHLFCLPHLLWQLIILSSDHRKQLRNHHQSDLGCWDFSSSWFADQVRLHASPSLTTQSTDTCLLSCSHLPDHSEHPHGLKTAQRQHEIPGVLSFCVNGILDLNLKNFPLPLTHESLMLKLRNVRWGDKYILWTQF